MWRRVALLHPFSPLELADVADEKPSASREGKKETSTTEQEQPVFPLGFLPLPECRRHGGTRSLRICSEDSVGSVGSATRHAGFCFGASFCLSVAAEADAPRGRGENIVKENGPREKRENVGDERERRGGSSASSATPAKLVEFADYAPTVDIHRCLVFFFSLSRLFLDT